MRTRRSLYTATGPGAALDKRRVFGYMFRPMCAAALAKFRCLLWAILVGIASRSVGSAEPPELTAWLNWRSTLWSWTPRDAQSELEHAGASVRWDSRREVLDVDGGWVFGSLPFPGAEFRFAGRRPVRWEGVLYDRDLHGQVSEGWMEFRIAKVRSFADRWSASPPMVMERPDGWSALVWGRSPHLVSLEWTPQGGDGPSVTTLRRLRIVVEPWPPRRNWTERVERSEDGDRFLAVPMVDQEVQGNCAPATVERILRYYGIPMQASQMSRLAESTPEAGTNVQRMLGELARLRGLRCEIREMFGFELRRFDRLLARYNREALRQGKPELTYTPPELDLARVFAAADPEVLGTVSSRLRERRSFWRHIRRTVDAGHPLMWGVVLGLVSENGPPMRMEGGHLRLIVGYNARTREVLYSDSWGEGHERKRMSLEDAWTMTMTLHALVPPP